jgi:uncharacterized protein YkuJ
MTKRKYSKSMVKVELARIGAEMYPQRQMTQEGVRVFLVKYSNRTNGFRTLSDVMNWAIKIRFATK